MKITNLIFLRQENKILLAMKKRGFGVGKINGVGGKVQPNETVLESAVRETKEEIGVDIQKSDLEKIAEITFIFKDKEGWDIICHIYFAYKWSGEPVETEEMAPQWYTLGDIPYEKMWIDDKYWLPEALKGNFVKAEFTFQGEGSILDSHKLETTPRK